MNVRFLKMMLVATTLASPAQAEVVGEVIASYIYAAGSTALFSAANGAQYATVPCRGDLSHGGIPRYFLRSEPSANLLPDGYQGSEMVASDEDCTQSVVIGTTPDMRFSTVPRWSPDGTRIATYAERWDLQGGGLAEQGIFIMDVIEDLAGFPTGVENLRLIIPLPGEGSLSWCDNNWLVYHAGVPEGTGTQNDLFLFDVDLESGFNVTNTPGVSELNPSCSPIDDRIAYSRLVAIRGSYRFDIFTIDAVSGATVQVTGKKTTGSPANRTPQFSPDGQYLAFSSGSLVGPIMPFDIYKIRSDGSGKAVNLTSRREGDFRAPIWRE